VKGGSSSLGCEGGILGGNGVLKVLISVVFVIADFLVTGSFLSGDYPKRCFSAIVGLNVVLRPTLK